MKFKKSKLIKNKQLEFEIYENKYKYPWWMQTIDIIIGLIISIIFVLVKKSQYDVSIIVALFFAICFLCYILLFVFTYFIFVKRLWTKR